MTSGDHEEPEQERDRDLEDAVHHVVDALDVETPVPAEPDDLHRDPARLVEEG